MRLYYAALNCVGIGFIALLVGCIVTTFRPSLLWEILGYSGIGLVALGLALMIVSWFRRQ